MTTGSMTKAELVRKCRACGSDEEALRGHRRHGFPQHHRGAAPRERSSSGALQFPSAQAEPRKGESEDRRQLACRRRRCRTSSRQRAQGAVNNDRRQSRRPRQAIVPPDRWRYNVSVVSRQSSDMERLWAPWRSAYVTGSGAPAPTASSAMLNRRDELILVRGRVSFVILTFIPTTTAT